MNESIADAANAQVLPQDAPANIHRFKRSTVAALIIASFVVAIMLWLPFRPSLLYSEDCINFARALQRFDPAASRPQWPGYPLFVVQSKALHTLFRSIENTFLVEVIIGTAVAFVFIILLGRELGGSWEAGFTAVLLFITNPAFLLTGLTSTIRIYLAAISTAVAYFCWRTWKGDSRSWPATLALGIGSGYRPELIAVLLPLWAYTTWRFARTRRDSLRAVIPLAFFVLGWLAILVYGGPPLGRIPTELHTYLARQAATTSPLYGASMQGWVSMLARLAAWNSVAIAGWITFVPLAHARLPVGGGRFLALWICPVLLFHALIHIGAADHALITIPAFCLLGGIVLSRLLQRRLIIGMVALVLALTLDLKTFFRPISMHPEKPAVGIQFFGEQFREGLWDMSLPVFRDVETQSEISLRHIHEYIRAASGSVLIVWDQSRVIWQKVSYYFPAEDIWILNRAAGQPYALRVRDGVVLERFALPVRIPLRGASRIILLAPVKRLLTESTGLGLQCADGNTCCGAARPVRMRGYDLAP